MTSRSLTFALLAALSLVLCGVAAAQETLVSDIPFGFDAGGRAHPAGRYELQIDADKENAFLTSPTGAREVLLVVTRLAAPERPASKGRLVFDVVGDAHTLSEMWVPGEDGFLLFATKGKHTHRTTGLAPRGR